MFFLWKLGRNIRYKQNFFQESSSLRNLDLGNGLDSGVYFESCKKSMMIFLRKKWMAFSR